MSDPPIIHAISPIEVLHVVLRSARTGRVFEVSFDRVAGDEEITVTEVEDVWSHPGGESVVSAQHDGEHPSTTERACGFPDVPCTCTNGIGCANVPVEEW